MNRSSTSYNLANDIIDFLTTNPTGMDYWNLINKLSRDIPFPW